LRSLCEIIGVGLGFKQHYSFLCVLVSSWQIKD
jgi:hypothetical protein